MQEAEDISSSDGEEKKTPIITQGISLAEETMLAQYGNKIRKIFSLLGGPHYLHGRENDFPAIRSLIQCPIIEQKSDLWRMVRGCCMTAADAEKVIDGRRPKSFFDLKTGRGYHTHFTNKAMEHGVKYEPEALQKYCHLRSVDYHQFGLLYHQHHPWLAASPDGITTDGILLEVKCPYTRKIEMGVVPKCYIPQVQFSLECYNLECCDFIQYVPHNEDPRCSDGYLIDIVRVERDRDWWKKQFPHLQNFWLSVLKWRRENGVELDADIPELPNLYGPWPEKPNKRTNPDCLINIDGFIESEEFHVRMDWIE